MSDKKGWQSMLRKTASTIFGSFVSTIMATGVLFAYTKDERDKEQKEARKREAALFQLRIEKMHKEYSRCMFDLYDFTKQHETQNNNYAQEFKEKMIGNPTERMEVKRVNECRSTTKDFWRLVSIYKNTYGLTEDEKNAYKTRHNRFVTLVKPLDTLPDYTPEFEHDVYDLFE